jgi:hypothetical protein
MKVFLNENVEFFLRYIGVLVYGKFLGNYSKPRRRESKSK